jgi:hypothetical protein
MRIIRLRLLFHNLNFYYLLFGLEPLITDSEIKLLESFVNSYKKGGLW